MKGGPASQSCGPAKRIDMKILRALALKIGYDVHSTKRSHLTLAQHLPKVLISHQISTVIDVGANAGQFATKLRAGGFTGRIKSFEPIPLHAQKVAALFAVRGHLKPARAGHFKTGHVEGLHLLRR